MPHDARPMVPRDALAMGLSGLVVAVLVPGVIRVTRWYQVWDRLSLPAGVALPLFLLMHAAATLVPMSHGAASPAAHTTGC